MGITVGISVSLDCFDLVERYSHRESNPDQRFRKPPFYPFNYGTNATAKVSILIKI